MDFTGRKGLAGGWTVPESSLPQAKTDPQNVGRLYPSSTVGSLFKWTVVSEAYRTSGISHPRDHRGGVQPKQWRLDEPCEFYFGPYGWCPDGHSCRYSHRMQTWLEDRERKGLGRKRKFHEI